MSYLSQFVNCFNCEGFVYSTKYNLSTNSDEHYGHEKRGIILHKLKLICLEIVL